MWAARDGASHTQAWVTSSFSGSTQFQSRHTTPWPGQNLVLELGLDSRLRAGYSLLSGLSCWVHKGVVMDDADAVLALGA